MTIIRCKSFAIWVLVLLAGLVLAYARNAQAQASDSLVFPDFEWEPVTDADWSLDLTWLDEQPDAVMIFEKVIDDDRLIYWQIQQKREYTRTRILSDKGQAAAVVKFTYYPDSEDIVELQCRTVLRDGRVFELNRQDILAQEKKVGEHGEGRLVTFSYPSADADCVVEYCLGLKQKIPNHIFTYRERLVQKDIPLMLGEYDWFYANEKGIDDTYADLGYYQYVWSGPYPDIIKAVDNGWLDHGITQIVRNVPAWRKEPMALPETATRLQIWQYYAKDTPRQMLAKIAGSYREPEPDSYDFGTKDEQVIHEVADLFRTIGDPVETARAVYTWLQDSIANSSYLGSPPERVTGRRRRKVHNFTSHKHLRDALKKKYGSWRDIDCLFYRLLKDLGVETMPALVVGRDEGVFNEKAGFFQFSRFVIAVKDSVSSLGFYAPGEYCLPFGQLHWSVEATDALLCDGSVVRIPYSPPESNFVARTLTIDCGNDDSITAKLTERHSGHKGRMCHVFAAGSDPERLDEYLRDSLKSLLPGATGTIDAIEMDSGGGASVEVQYSLSYGSLPETKDSLLEIKPLLYAPDTASVFVSPVRYGEIVFQYAYRTLDTVRVSLSERTQVTALQADSSIVTDAGYCNVSFTSDSTGVVVVREFVLERPRFSVNEYAAVQQLFAARAAFSRLPVTLRRLN